MIICTRTYYKQLISAWDEIKDIDNNLKKKNLVKKVSFCNHIVWKKSTIFLITNIALAIIFLISENPDWQLMLVQIIFAFISITNKVQFLTWIAIIRDRFSLLNYYLTTIIQELDVDDILCEEINEVTNQHRRLITIVKTINESYSIMLLLLIILDATEIITHAYILAYMYFTEAFLQKENLWSMVSIIGLATYFSMELIILTTCIVSMCRQANFTKIIIYKTKCSPQKIEICNAVKQTTFYLMRNTASISPCKLFNVDYGMIYSIFTTITNYLVIMIQLDPDLVARSRNYTTNTF
ncbi:hypothetical protein FQR65_LT07054 [Abscondita terminalis]|nr:hypothetical protein FQR65_LT07054 [Abscondita terminalis]